MIRKNPSRVIHQVHDEVDKAVEESGRQQQVAVIGEHGGLAEESSAQRHAGRVELGQVQLHDIVLSHEFCRDPAERGRDDSFADANCNRYADDFHTIQRFFARKRWVILRGHHGHLMPALDERARESLRVDGQPRCVRAIVSENSENFHKAGGLYPRGTRQTLLYTDFTD